MNDPKKPKTKTYNHNSTWADDARRRRVGGARDGAPQGGTTPIGGGKRTYKPTGPIAGGGTTKKILKAAKSMVRKGTGAGASKSAKRTW